MKKTVLGILLLISVGVILFLTFQDSAGTAHLSESVRLWFEKKGFPSDYHSFRSNAHLVLYFAFGVILCLFGRECGWDWWMILAVGCGAGLIDESIKILLPTREFEAVDLLKDCIGILAAICVINVAGKLFGKNTNRDD